MRSKSYPSATQVQPKWDPSSSQLHPATHVMYLLHKVAISQRWTFIHAGFNVLNINPSFNEYRRHNPLNLTHKMRRIRLSFHGLWVSIANCLRVRRKLTWVSNSLLISAYNDLLRNTRTTTHEITSPGSEHVYAWWLYSLRCILWETHAHTDIRVRSSTTFSWSEREW